MYYGNKAKVHIPNWWEIRKMCKGLERLKPQVSVMLECVGSFDGVPKGKRYLDLSANEDGIDMKPHYFWSDYKKMPPQEAAQRRTWNRIRDRGYKPADQPDETLAHFGWKDVYGFSYDKSTRCRCLQCHHHPAHHCHQGSCSWFVRPGGAQDQEALRVLRQRRQDSCRASYHKRRYQP